MKRGSKKIRHELSKTMRLELRLYIGAFTRYLMRIVDSSFLQELFLTTRSSVTGKGHTQ